MCDRSIVLVIFLILKILFLIVMPIALYFLYKKKMKEFNIIGVLDIFFLLIFILLKLFGNPCITNSNFSYIKNNTNSINNVYGNNEVIYGTINATSKYNYKSDKNAYYYGLNYEPLKNYKLSCDKKSYMKNYGSSISAISTLIANTYNSDLNIVEVISYLNKNNLIDCENGIDFDNSINKLGEKYHYNYYQITSFEVNNYLSAGKSVLVETKNNNTEKNNFGCEKDYIVIYNKNNDGNYNIINPNDKDYSYFCPSNTIGYGSIIEKNQNNRTYTLDEIDSKALRYFVIEVR